MNQEDTDKMDKILADYRTRANDAKVYLDIMQGRLTWLRRGLTINKTLTLVIPVLLAVAIADLKLPKEVEVLWHRALLGLTTLLAVLIALAYGSDWDIKAVAYQFLIQELKVHQLNFQRQLGVIHDNANNSGYTHRLAVERHIYTLGRIADYVTDQDFKERAKELELAPKGTP
jgi:hypothetical protein